MRAQQQSRAAASSAWPLQTQLADREVALVRQTYRAIAGTGDSLAEHFYDKLFELDPSLRELFPADMAAQREKLMLALEHTVGYLDSVDSWVDQVRELGRRHRVYGARELDYATVGDALLMTLERALGSHWTADVERAWEKTFTLLSQVMVQSSPGGEP